MLIIALHGPAGSGKDTVAEHLYVTYGFEADAFAFPLREAALLMFSDLGLTEEHFTDRARKERPLPAIGHLSPREILRIMGEAFRDRDSRIWIKLLAARLQQATAQGIDRMVITDVRLDSEAEFLHSLGAHIWVVQRPGYGFRRDHGTEMGIDSKWISRGILNDGSIEDLEARVDSLLKPFVESEAVR